MFGVGDFANQVRGVIEGFGRLRLIDAVKTLIGSDLFFRFHDSGDLINERHLSLIVQVAIEMPGVSFWMPTKEKSLISRFLKEYGPFPSNLCVRLSDAMLDQSTPNNLNLPTSSIHKAKPAIGFECGAPSRGGYCGDCRACWNSDVQNVSYKFH